MTSHNDDVSALNHLTKHLLDSAKGYEDAASVADDPKLSQEFASLSAERRNAAGLVQGYVASLGGDPETSGSALGAAHRAFTGLRGALQNGSKAAIEEVERGEDFLRDRVRETLTKISPDARAALEPIARDVQADHDRWSALKHQLQGAGDMPGGKPIS